MNICWAMLSQVWVRDMMTNWGWLVVGLTAKCNRKWVVLSILTADATTLVKDINGTITLVCNSTTSSNQSITWLKSFDKININIIKNDSTSYYLDSMGLRLTLNTLSLSDQQYYGCFFNSNNESTHAVVKAYYLIVRSKRFF